MAPLTPAPVDAARRHRYRPVHHRGRGRVVDENSQFTEDQRAEAFRQEHARHLYRQTRALETIRTILVVWAILTIIGVLFIVVEASSGM